jgi:hypothetical protein
MEIEGNQPTNKLVNQACMQTDDQSTKLAEPTGQTIKQPANPLTHQPTIQPTGKTTKTTKQPTNDIHYFTIITI